MDRVNKIMVIDYSIPKNDKDAANLLEYFAIPGTSGEHASRMTVTIKDFLEERDCDDVATWFLRMFEQGRISPQEVLLFAVAGWARPIVDMQKAQSGIKTLLKALNDATEE